MTKLSGGIYPILVGETLYQFTSHILCLHFHDTFTTHLSTHQFDVATKGGREVVIHGIKCTLDLHLNCIVFLINWMWQTLSIQCQEGSYFKNFM
jgi:hypothetical protein